MYIHIFTVNTNTTWPSYEKHAPCIYLTHLPPTYNYTHSLLHVRFSQKHSSDTRETFSPDPNSNNFVRTKNEMKPDPVAWIVLYNIPFTSSLLRRHLRSPRPLLDVRKKRKKNPVQSPRETIIRRTREEGVGFLRSQPEEEEAI